MRFFRLNQKYQQAGPRIQISHVGQFSLDFEERRLIEDDTVNGNYLASDGYLFCGEQEVGGPGLKDLEISPDGKRAIWISEDKLFYHDSASEAAEPVMEDSNVPDGLLFWLQSEDLKVQTVAANTPIGWTAFKDRPAKQKKDDDDDELSRQRWRARKDIKEHLVLTVATNKEAYLLHEPVEVTLTFKSTSEMDIEFESNRIIKFDMDYPGGSKELECEIHPYDPNQETIVLGPGESITVTGTFEVALAGDYKIRSKYERFESPWRGEIEADVVFRVNPVGSAQKEKQFFEAKFERLVDKVCREGSRRISDYSFTRAMISDEIVGISGMGPDVVPYILEAIKDKESKWLYDPLKSFVGPEALGFFQDRLMHGDYDDWGQASGWLYDLFEKGQDGSSEAYASLLSAMNHENAGVRRKVVEHLVRIYDPNVKTVFESAIEDDDEEVRIKAARYLAGAECLDLDQWLDVAANEPTAARYIAANSIIKQIEKRWNITKGQIPDVTWKEASRNPEVLEQYSTVVRAWQEWASENLRFSSQFFEREHQGWLNGP
jgi:hypothetical protein